LVPQFGHSPWVAGFLFFMVICFGFLISTFFLHFIQSVEVDGIHLAINYTIPLVAGPYEGELTEAAAVLPIIQNGSPLWTKGKTKTFEKTFALVY